MTSRCLGNGRSDASYEQYGGVSASYKQFSVSASYKQYVSDECTYNIQSRQKHNMLSLLHAACLTLLVFFFSASYLRFRQYYYSFPTTAILVTLACILTILRLGFELFFLVRHTYDFFNITVPSLRLQYSSPWHVYLPSEG